MPDLYRGAPPIFREYGGEDDWERTLLHAVQHALRGALASSLLVAASCASSPKQPQSVPENALPSPLSTRLPAQCEARLSAIRPALPLDYLSLRTVSNVSPAADELIRTLAADQPEVQVLAETGTPCLHAPDSTCRERLRGGRYTEEGGVETLFVGTHGGELHVFRLTELRDLFGPIDSPVEVLWLVQHAGYSIEGCLGDLVTPTADGYRAQAVRHGASCGTQDDKQHWTEYVLEVRVDATIESVSEGQRSIQCQYEPIEGRRPAGLVPRAAGTVAAAGEHFARAAHDEAASIAAFLQLEAELARLGAPAGLLRGARRAARDEVRHAGVMRALARRFGGKPERAVVQVRRPRSLLEMALDNAIEGCVNETFAAARVAHQAWTSRDGVVRRALSAVARDEIRHAAWSWRLAAWAEPRLKPRERRAVAEARLGAMDRLEALASAPSPQLVRDLAGLPDPATARGIIAGLRDAL